MTRPRDPRGETKPTSVWLVREAIAKADDFMTVEMIVKAIGRKRNNVTAAVHWLKSRRVIDAVEVDLVLWWFITGEDDRHHTTDVITAEPIHKRPYHRRPNRKKGGPSTQATTASV